jgi:hypothetical protein
MRHHVPQCHGGSRGRTGAGLASQAVTVRQRRTDPAELGRVLSVSMSLNLSGGPIGSVLACALATTTVHLISAQSDRVMRTPAPPAP